MPSESVKVIVRCRPMNGREKDKQCSTIVQTDEKNMQLTLTNPAESDSQKVFPYDAVFGMNSLQQTIYEDAAFPLVESVMEGYNGTIFAYGQTGCGKTHTMMGVTSDESLKGIIPRAFDHIFGRIETANQKNYLVRCSYIEIYNEEIHDLIGEDVRTKLDLKENTEKGIFIKGLSMHVVKSVPEIHKLMSLGSKNRSVGETAMNKDSSRSHSIFTIYVESSETDPQGNARITLGKLNLVDLAGSERQSKTGATGDRLKEANKINLSLSALGNVISALVDGKSSHIPYRDSKLTRLLQDSLGGNTKTVMVANVSPASDNYDETLGTLRYASRAKNIKNQPKVNEDPKDAMLREYADEIKRLKEMLANGGELPAHSHTNAKKSISELGSAGDVDGHGHGHGHKVKRGDSHYENQLKQKNDEINDERKKREELENRLKEMQQLVGSKGEGQGSNNVNQAEKKKYQEMAQKLKEQHQTHEQLLKEKNQKEEEMLVAEKKYANLQEEVEEQRKIIKRLRKKYKEAAGEIKDLARENELNKEDLLDTIRLLERDVKINNAIMLYMLSPEELERIRSKARWHDDRNEFVVPPFIVRARKVKFPKISQQQGMNMVQEEWDNRELEFVNYKTDSQADRDDYASDRDWEDNNQGSSYGGGKHLETTPQRFGKDRYAASQSPITSYETKVTAQKNYASKGMFDAGSNRETMRNTVQGHQSANLQPQKKQQTKNVMLDPISSTQLSNNAVRSAEGGLDKGFKSGFAPANIGNLGALNNLPPMKGKAQLQPLNHPTGGNQTMKLSFKATLLINGDGTNAELQNMTSHVKGY